MKEKYLETEEIGNLPVWDGFVNLTHEMNDEIIEQMVAEKFGWTDGVSMYAKIKAKF